MSHALGVRQPLRRCIFRLGARLQCANGAFESQSQSITNLASLRHASGSNQPQKAPQGTPTRKAIQRRGVEAENRKRELESSRKVAILLKRLSKVGKKAPPAATTESPKETSRLSTTVKSSISEDEFKEVEVDQRELAVQRQIVQNRKKLLWPGIWTFFAITGTYAAFAYLDATFNSRASPDTTQLAGRTELPQTWYLTPEVVTEGIKAGWDELDKLTIGIVLVCIGIHFMKKSPLPFWEKLIHITGEKKYTAFTYTFLHTEWKHLGQNMFILCWFMPGVVRHLDGDVFQAAALYTTVPLFTSYLLHFAFRWSHVAGIALNVGASGAVAAIFGAFCIAYPDEKVWLPSFFVLRLDAKYWGLVFSVWQLASMVKVPKGGNRPAYFVGYIFVLGGAYVYFDAKNNLWRPLTTLFARADKLEDIPA
ncbi:hypothetical protein CC86DRAFT_353103 [Ophiobolus disseminans]|uniref:Peptidase S54 rhomboid domain-containing protein n=1 Tax=Ophiobolus disseminans TaxID=1469910 RepID=A0A6A6ZVY9_9PLEO|nr:hypothetical protein CC86DRAFT_353103 [Ophiobolus disseminans]